MAYCAICGGNHSPDYPCSCQGEETLHNMGIKGETKRPDKKVKELERKADRYMLKLALIIIAFFILVIAVFSIIGGTL